MKLKKLMAILLTAAMVLPLLTMGVYASNNTSFTTQDALIALQASAGLVELTEEQRARYGIRNDNRVSVADALRLLRISAGLPARGVTEQEQLNSVIAEVMGLLNPNMSEFEKVTFLFDWVKTNVEYDHSLSKGTAYHALVERSSVCNGFARGLQTLLDNAGIENKFITGDLGSDATGWGGHAWNMIKVDGNWYYADITHSRGYKHFLLSERALRADHRWDTSELPATPSISFGGTDQRNYFIPNGNNVFYYEENLQRLQKYDGITGITTTVESNITHRRTVWIGRTGFVVDTSFSDDYWFYVNNQGKNILYSMAYGTKIETPDSINGRLGGSLGDIAFFVNNISFTAFNTKTHEVQETEISIENSFYFHQIGSFNGKVYFYSFTDLFLYDIENNTFSKLTSPAGIVTGRWLNQVRIVENNDLFYLTWEIVGSNSPVINGKLQIT
jgi:hypothetical protein